MGTLFKFENHSSDVMKSLDELRSENILCDGILESSDGQKFPVHRSVLAAASPYFRGMFSGAFQETNNSPEIPIALPTVASVGLESVLDCLYSGELVLTDDGVYAVFAAAHMFQLPNIVNSCTEFLIDNMSTVTCFQNLKLAEKYALPDVEQSAHDFTLRNFVKLSETKEFKEMSVDQLSLYLSDAKLKGQEIDIFKAVKLWLNFEEERKEHLPKMMSQINFKAIPAQIFADIIAEDESLKSDKECLEMIFSAWKYHTHVFTQPLNVSPITRGEDSIVIISSGNSAGDGTYRSAGPAAMYWWSNDEVGGAPNRTQIRLQFKVACSSVSVVKVNNFLFLFGTDSDSFTSIAKRFGGTTGVWMDLAPVPRLGTAGSTASYVDGSVVLVGGMLLTEESKYNTLSSQNIDTTLGYSIVSNEWKRLSDCPVSVVYHAACSHNDFVYIAGGYTQGQTSLYVPLSSKLYAYDFKADMWLSKASMSHGRAEAVLEAVNNKLFAIGGSDSYGRNTAIRSIEIYDIVENQWTMVENEPGFPCDSAASFVDEKNIVIVGGFDHETKKLSNKVSVFRTESKKITTLQHDMGVGVRRHGCTVLKM